MINIEKIIKNRCVKTHFQAILSPEIDFVAGVEALSRAYNFENGELIPPFNLFQEASNKNLIIELEKLLIEESMNSFRAIYEYNTRMLLFINVSEEFFECAIEEDYINQMAIKYNVNTRNIVLDIHPCDHLSWDETQAFCDYHRKKGCYICLDDIGIDYLNLDLIIFLLPDIIKVNVIKGRELTNQTYVNNAINYTKDICNSQGIQMVSKGVETDHDIEFAIKNDAKFLQGYYISKPQELDNKKLDNIISQFREKMNRYEIADHSNLEHSRKILNEAVNIITKVKTRLVDYDEDTVLAQVDEFFTDFSAIENIWFLNPKGIQYMDTIINEKVYHIKRSPMFRIYNEGSDFRGKDLYYQLQNTVLTTWVTEPYRSILSNNICVCASTYIRFADKDLILCMNINYDKIK